MSEPAVETLIFLALSSAAVLGPSGRTTIASKSGGPAMAATALIGAPLTMNAIAGPGPSATSRLSEAIACCMRASPVKAIDSMSSPLFANRPLRMPMSRGTNENASGTALPTRRVSAAPAPGIQPPAASKSIAAIKQRNGAFIGMARLPFQFTHNPPLIPAQAGIQEMLASSQSLALGPRFRGDERTWAVINLIRTISF